MNTRTLSTAVLLALCLGASACSGTEQAAEAVGKVSNIVEAGTAEDGAAVKALDEARQKLRTENFSLTHQDGGPKAELTPEGEFLIDGKPVPMTDAQREMLGQYRNELIEVADAGIVLAQSGLVIAGKAVSQAFSGLFSGGSNDAKTGIEAEAKKIEAAALQLCDRAKALRITQESLTAVLPEFAPYAGSIKTELECKFDSESDAGSDKPAPPTISA